MDRAPLAPTHVDPTPGRKAVVPTHHSPLATDHPPHTTRHSPLTTRHSPLTVWLLATCLLPLVVGCRGCASSSGVSDKEREEKLEALKKKEKPKPEFEFLRFTTQPGEVEKSERVQVSLKPGHWTSAVLEVRANHNDFRGELLSELATSAGRPVSLDEMSFQLRTTRPIILPKGQKRLIEFSLVTPVETRAKQVATRLLTGPGGRAFYYETHVVQPMPPHQYYFIVLADQPAAYSFLKRLDTFNAPTERFYEPTASHHYRLIAPRIARLAPLPSHPLSWTSIAYVLWDDLAPKKLSPEQQQSLIDWLHWGGQLIMSGPETLATLKGSPLEAYLPAAAGASWQLDSETLQPLSSDWMVGDKPIKVVRPWSGVHLKLAEDAQPLLTVRGGASDGEALIAERRVGRGRVVVSAFRLSQRNLRDWPSFDGFLNGCLMRRPPRRFFVHNEQAQVGWVDGRDSHDPRRVTRLRYFTRDAAAAQDMFPGLLRVRAVTNPPPTDASSTFGLSYNPQPQANEGEVPYGPGVAGWNDFSPASSLALATLREAAGIIVPDATFVVYVLAIYVLVLVPVNWTFFRLLGRVEWAWAAAPFISIAGAIAVVYLAQLDIGFARSQTELDVVEIQGGHSRAHLTRYVALYSSLGTRYEMQFDDLSAEVLPFSTGQEQETSTVDYRRAPRVTDEDEVAQVTLDGMFIRSNATGMIHGEEMRDVGGGFEWRHLTGNRYRVTNRTDLNLQSVGVVGLGRAGWIGNLKAGAAAEVELTDLPKNPDALWATEREESPMTSAREVTAGLNLRYLMMLAQNEQGDSAQNETRLVGWTADDLPGMAAQPRASQTRRAALVVGHLDYGVEPAPARDANSRPIAYQEADKLPPPEDDEDENE